MMNLVILSGFIANDLGSRTTGTGKTVCNFNLAVRRNQNDTDFIPVTCWGSTADFLCRNFHKGSRIEVTGRLRQNNWTDDKGTKHYSLVVDASELSFGERAPKQGQNQEVSAEHTPVQEYVPAYGYPPVPDLAPTPDVVAEYDLPF